MTGVQTCALPICEYRDDRHNLVSALFTVETKVPVAFNFELSEDKSTINLSIRNFEGLGTHLYRFQPEQIDEQFLDQMGRYLLRADNHFVRLEISDDERQKLRQRLSGEHEAITVAPVSTELPPETLSREAIAPKAKAKVVNKKPGKVSARKTAAKKMTPPPSAETTSSIDRTIVEKVLTEKANTTSSAPAEPVVANYNPTGIRFAELPTPYKEVDRQLLNAKNYLLGLDGLGNYPDRFFQTANSMLLLLNHTILKPEKRLELVEAMLVKVYPLFVAMYEQYQAQEHSLPENRMRRTVLTAAATAASLFAIAYKQVLVAMHPLVMNASAVAQEKFALSGFRVLELSRIEQRLKALRYEKLSRQDWLDINKVFFILYDLRLVDVNLCLAGKLGLPASHEPHATFVSSGRKLAFSLHLFGLFEVTTWPMRFFNIPDAYLLYLDYPFKVLADRGKPLLPGWMLIAAQQDGPAQLSRQQNYAGQSLLIEYSGLYNTLVEEHEQVARQQFLHEDSNVNLSPPLLTLTPAERIPVLELMIFNLRFRERHQKRHHVTGQEYFRIGFGYRESLCALEDNDKKKLSGMMRWRLVNFSTGGLLLTAEESDTPPIKLGQLVCFVPEDNRQEPLLGYISRLQRVQGSRVEIAIVRISSYAEMITIRDLGKSEEKDSLPALLIQDLDNAWKLVTHHSYAYISGTPLHISRMKGPLLPARLADVWLRKSEFTVFELSSPGLDSRG